MNKPIPVNKKRAFYRKMHTILDGRCMICHKQEPLVVDIHPVTGEMRGLLCYTHNAGLGMFDDNPELLEQAATYLKDQGAARVGLVEDVSPSYKVDYNEILALLKANPERSRRSVAREYAEQVGCTLSAAQTRVNRVAKRFNVRHVGAFEA